MERFSLSPLEIARSCLRNRGLLARMVRRDVAQRYRGSVMGIFWSLATPLVMLGVYTFVFSVVFQARWGADVGNRFEFALVLFAGLICFNFFAENFGRAPRQIIDNVNYVKKVVFPLEALAMVSMGSVLFHTALSACILIVAGALLLGTLHWTLVFLPVVFAPFMIFTLGAVWFTSALAVYWRDLTEVAPIIITMLMFLSPIFYPLEAVPQAFRGFIMLNPLAFVIGQVRTIVLWGQPPDFAGLALYTACALAICWAGFAWFQKSRKGFADVL